MKDNKDLEIYIHIPFCVQKCRYCDFLSAPAGEETKQRYMKALCQEILQKSSSYEAYKVSSIFIGGGTPSCVNPHWIRELLTLLKKHFHLRENAEISMEINPGTVDKSGLAVYYGAGINRLSIGLQSARQEELLCLGRIHNFEQFTEAYFTAREIGFSNINVDIMSGLPGQTCENYLETLKKVTSLQPPPEHISAYSLIIEEGTPFFQAYEEGKLFLPDEDTEREMYELTGAFLQKKGYERYEISNYAKPGKKCRHNVGYWTRKNYVGFGIGAASLVENVRFKNHTDMESYMQNPCGCKVDIEYLTKEEQMEETMFLGLRLTEGVSCKVFRETFGADPEQVYAKVMEKHIKNGLLRIVCENGAREENLDRRILLTAKGLDVSNYVMADFLEP